MPNLIFFPVQDTTSKLLKICQTAHQHMEKKEPLTILVPDMAALHFVDDLLWRFPEEGFLPHPSPFLSIVLEVKGGRTALFNLRPIAYTENFFFKTVYELEDHTSEERLQLSKGRYQVYREANFPISFL